MGRIPREAERAGGLSREFPSVGQKVCGRLLAGFDDLEPGAFPAVVGVCTILHQIWLQLHDPQRCRDEIVHRTSLHIFASEGHLSPGMVSIRRYDNSKALLFEECYKSITKINNLGPPNRSPGSRNAQAEAKCLFNLRALFNVLFGSKNHRNTVRSGCSEEHAV